MRPPLRQQDGILSSEVLPTFIIELWAAALGGSFYDR